MGLLLQCLNIKKEFGDKTVLKDISFDVEVGDRIGIVGNNGAGKTTLAHIITNTIKADKGNILWHNKDIKIGYLHQSTYYTQREFQNMIKGDQEEIREFFQTTKELGVNKIEGWDNRRLSNLSGGEKTKLAIAKIWAEKPQLLILDEPTNHMDYEGVQWLISEIEKYKGTILVISHDRYFMDQSVDRIIEIEDGEAHCYRGNYTFYRDEKKRIYESQLQHYKEQEKYKDKIQNDIKRLKGWSEKGHRQSTKKEGFKEFHRVKAKKKDKQVKSKIKRFGKIEVEGVKKPKEEQQIKFNFNNDDDKCGDRILEAKSIGKSFGNKKLFEDSSFYIQRGEKIALFGKNGCGKTTLINAIFKEIYMDEGELYLSSSAKVAYLSQDVMNLDGNKTVFETFGIENYKIRGILQTLLANMGFSKDMIHKKVNTLSLGERTRLKVAYMIMMENNVLILDEPTNHLDVHSREMLEEALENYMGTIILVSHDRYILERICNKVLIFKNKKIKRYEYSFKEYINREERNKKSSVKKSIDEQLMILENKIAGVVGKLSCLTPDMDKYKELDEEFRALIAAKKEIRNKKY